MMRGPCLCILLALSLPLSCATIAGSFRTVHLTAGMEVAAARFSTSVGGLPGYILQRDEDEPELRYHAEPVAKPKPFYSIGTNPSPLPFVGGLIPYLNTVVRQDVVLTSERTWRGELFNYPDDGRVGITPFEALLYEAFPLDGALARRTDYVFRQFYFAVRLYLGYFGEDWEFALRTTYGQARYDLLLIEGGIVRSDVRNHFRPRLGTGVLIRFRIGRLFDSEVLARTHLFLETATQENRRGAVRTELLRSNGTSPNPLFVSEDEVRFGVTRSLDLW